MNGNERFATSVLGTLRGMFGLALGRVEAFREFGNTPAAFSASIAPLIAFPLVGAALLGLRGYWVYAASLMLSRLCGVLLQPVIVEFAARRLNRGERWLTTSTALNWSIWIIFVLIPAGMVVNAGLVSVAASLATALAMSAALIGAYMLWLQAFILRTGLKTGWWKAIALLLVVNLGVAILYAVPYLFHPELLRLTVSPPSG